uniref:Rho termination factor n=1 Tax=Marseillevirus LCMAC201 TaxID=2506605 RepID=A0A481YW27_9VIRU|nr:MAG: Rho termination factor [Marseillevirus LCMAC201]
MPETITNGCKCQFTGNEPSPTGKGLCPQCYPKGYRALGPRELIWVIKTRSDGTNYWANVHAASMHKDGNVWKCTDCVKEPVQPKVVCISGVCKVQPNEARFYEFPDTDSVEVITASGATYGDIISNKEGTYIVSKSGTPEKLAIDSSNQFIIPDTCLNDLGIFYWNNIAEDADLGYPYTRKHFEELQEKLYNGKIHMQGLLKEYGIVIVSALAKSKQVVKKKIVKKVKAAKKRSNLDERTVIQLRALAKKRGRKITSNMKKADLIKLLRKKSVKRKGCYEAMTKTELLERASKRSITGRRSMSRVQLINSLRKK